MEKIAAAAWPFAKTGYSPPQMQIDPLFDMLRGEGVLPDEGHSSQFVLAVFLTESVARITCAPEAQLEPPLSNLQYRARTVTGHPWISASILFVAAQAGANSG